MFGIPGGRHEPRQGAASAAHAWAPRAAPARRHSTRDVSRTAQPHFTFGDATALIPYLAALGVSHVYCSPYLRARPGSLHGYDIVDHGMLNPEIGSRSDFDVFVATLDAHGMGHLCDVVPNHVGVMGSDNRWWMDVLENGPASVFADYFDIDWEPADPALSGRIVVPVLGDSYGLVLERGELELLFEAEAGELRHSYHEHRFPVDPSVWASLLDPVAAGCREPLPSDDSAALCRARRGASRAARAHRDGSRGARLAARAVAAAEGRAPPPRPVLPAGGRGDQ